MRGERPKQWYGHPRIPGMALTADYDRAVAYLQRSQLPAYVSFVEQASARGVAGDREDPQRIYVRISDGAVVSGVPPRASHVVRTDRGDGGNPFGKGWYFDSSCYVPTNEEQTRWNGSPAIRFQLRATCENDNAVSELYADPQTLRPMAVDGTIPDTEDAHMTIAVEVRYGRFAGYTVPMTLNAHAVGHGWLFWARERVEVDYTGYQFYQTAEFARRQASLPKP